MKDAPLIPHLFRTEYSKMIAVLCAGFGMESLELAEDVVSDTFLQAAETWGLKGLPANPVAWLYAVSKNKAVDKLRRDKNFAEKIAPAISRLAASRTEVEIDWSRKHVEDSKLQMMFAICHPCIQPESQVGLALNILCGFGAEEIADAFLTSKDTIYKRLARAKQKLRTECVRAELPSVTEINVRMDAVLTTIYLLFSEGYYSLSQNTTLRKDLCVEAMRLNVMLVENETTNTFAANALLALMCFHASRFDARMTPDGDLILYDEQDETLWNKALIHKGIRYLNAASGKEKQLTKYHLEAAIAYHYTQKKDTPEKWESILQLYNKLLQIAYSPAAALNRTYALSKARGREEAIAAAEKLGIADSHLYHSLLASLYKDVDQAKALNHLETALGLARTEGDRKTIVRAMARLMDGRPVETQAATQRP